MTTESMVPTAFAESAAASTAIVLVEDVSSGNLPSLPGALEIQSPDAISPVRPKHVTPERDQVIRAEAAALVAAILENPSDVTVTASVYGLGQEAEASNSTNVALVDQKIGPVLKEIGTESMLGKSLTQIKANLDLVNPHVVSTTPQGFTEAVEKGGFLGIGRRMVNEVVSRLPVGSNEVMTLINERSDTIRSTIDGLKTHLWEERDNALKNAIELGLVANHLADTQDELQEAAYQGQLIWEDLNVAVANETDPVRKQALTYLVNDIATRVVDLQTIDQLNIQSRMGAETLINNCRGIQILVNRVTNVLLPSVMTALAVKAAGAQQAQLASAARGIGDAAGRTIAETAGQIGRISVDIAKMNSESIIDLDKLEQAAASYDVMQRELDVVVADAEHNARAISNRMSALNERMRNRADPMTAARRAKEAAGV